MWVYRQKKKEYDEKIDIRMQVNYGEDTIQITWQEIVHANEDAQANENRSGRSKRDTG